MKDAITLLNQQHRHVIELFARFEDLRDGADLECKQGIVEDACDFLELHDRIAEEVFYPALAARADSRRLVDEARVKHGVVRHLSAELRAMDPDDPRYDATFTVLGEYVRYQVEMECSRMFPEARGAAIDLDKLGARMLRRLHELSRKGHRAESATSPASTTATLALAAG